MKASVLCSGCGELLDVLLAEWKPGTPGEDGKITVTVKEHVCTRLREFVMQKIALYDKQAQEQAAEWQRQHNFDAPSGEWPRSQKKAYEDMLSFLDTPDAR